MTRPINLPPLPEPAFNLRWIGKEARYTVSKPNIGDTEVFTREQLEAAQRAAVELDRAALDTPGDAVYETADELFKGVGVPMPLRISDPEAAEDLARLQARVCASPETALKFLQDAGILDEEGNLTERFGGTPKENSNAR